jgi:hypothetical protein
VSARRRATLAAAFVVCAVLAACGGSGGGGSTAPSADEYAAAADRLCVALDKRVAAVTSQRPASLADLRSYVDRLQAVVEDGRRRFAALPTPDGDAGRPARAYVAALTEAIDGRLKPALRRIREAIARGDLRGVQAAGRDVGALDGAELKRLARAAGAEQCAT